MNGGCDTQCTNAEGAANVAAVKEVCPDARWEVLRRYGRKIHRLCACVCLVGTNLAPDILEWNWVEKVIELNKSRSCFHLMLILCHQILMNAIILISVMVGSVPTFLESTVVCVMMKPWLPWTWRCIGGYHASRVNIYVQYAHTHIYIRRRGFFGYF